MPETVPRSPRWPRIVAEALAGVARPLATAAPPLRQGTAAQLHDVWCQAILPLAHAAPPPSFLLPQQAPAWRRVMAALELWGGAMLVEPVGTGKTWIALAAAWDEPEGVTVIGPAILRLQWQAAADRAGVIIHWWSHERLSRGHTPPGTSAMVIVDEAHRLRDATTRRVRTIAPWLRDHRVLLLTATPMVNHLDELVTLLRLFLPEDALRLDGVATLASVSGLASPPVALRRVVVRTAPGESPVHPSCMRTLPASDLEAARGECAVDIVRQLTARHRASWSRLLAAVLLDAAASSDAALLDSLRRYRALLRQALDAGSSDRVTLRRFAGEQLDQLVWWELVGAPSDTVPLPVDDLPLLDALMAGFTPTDRAWLAPLAARLMAGPPTVCFTRHRATAALLRTALGEGTAWVTGDAAGIGPHPLPRDAVLAAFGPGRAQWSIRRRLPTILVATDVAAEGLDLQSAGRLVHVDLPWTAMRVAQREGRLLRLGQLHQRIDIIARAAAPAVEDALARVVRVGRKRDLAARWLDGIAVSALPDAGEVVDGIPSAVVTAPPGTPASDVVLVALLDAASGRRGVMTVRRVGDGPWIAVTDGMDLTATTSPSLRYDRPTDATSSIAHSAAHWALREAHRRASWGPPRLVSRIHRLARLAAWRRDGDAVTRLEQTLKWCTAAPTLGDRLRLDHLAAAPDDEVAAFVAPTVAPAGPYHVAAIGVLLYRSAEPSLR